MAFSSIEPIGEFRNELRHAQTMQLLETAHFRTSKPLSHYMNFIEKPEEKKLTDAEIEAEFTRIFGA